MAFCKICDCGEKVVFERRMSFPDNCPSCGRRMVDFPTYREDDPRVAQILAERAAAGASGAGADAPEESSAGMPADAGLPEGGAEAAASSKAATGGDIASATPAPASASAPATPAPAPQGIPRTGRYALRLPTGALIAIPDEGCVVGRTEVGAEELAAYPSVSRRHLRVKPRRGVGVVVEDMSAYGTLVDGQPIERNKPVRVAVGSVITLCTVDATLVKNESEA